MTHNTSTVLLGNDESGQAGFAGRLIDPRFYQATLTRAEVSAVLAEQSLAACETSSCH